MPAGATCACCPTAGRWSPRISRLSAQWEHTILVTDTGYEVLTLGASVDTPAAAAAS